MALIQHLRPHSPIPAAAGTLAQFSPSSVWSGNGSQFGFPGTLPSGSLIVAGVKANVGGPPTFSGGGTGWTQADANSGSYLFYGVSDGSASTVTVNGSSQWAGIALNFTDVSTTMVAHAVSTGYSSSPSVTVNVPAAGQLVVAWVSALGPASNPSGWANTGDSGNLTKGWYRSAPSAGNLTITWSTNVTDWVAFVTVFAA